MSILENELDNLLYEVKNKKNLNKDILKKKYNNLFNSSEKLFDKILNPNLSSNDLSIIRIMIQKKDERDNGLIEKYDADVEIGQVLCDKIVKPLLNKDKNNKNKYK